MSIQGSINQGIATVAAAATLGKHIHNQNLEMRDKALKDWNQLADEAKDMKDAIDTEKANIDVEKQSQEDMLDPNLKRTNFRDSKGRFITNKQILEEQNKFIEESNMAIKESEDRLGALKYQERNLKERLDISDKMMGHGMVKRLIKSDLVDPNTHDYIMNLKQGVMEADING